jgi:hypothetical protein
MNTHRRLRCVSYGAGVQSTSLLVLAAQRRIDFPVFLFANVGNDSEDPATLAYLRQHAIPYAAAHDVELHELHRTRRDGSHETLYGRLTRPGSRSLPIPVRMSNGAPGTRSCCVICTSRHSLITTFRTVSKEIGVDLRSKLIEGRCALPKVGSLVPSDRQHPPVVVLDAQGDEVEPIVEYLRDLAIGDCSPLTCRSYGFGLLRWFRLLWALDVAWERATEAEVAVLAAWLRASDNPQRRRQATGAPEPGAVNLRTGKPSLRQGYALRTINHALTVVSGFYTYHAHAGRGPVVARRDRGHRPHPHLPTHQARRSRTAGQPTDHPARHTDHEGRRELTNEHPTPHVCSFKSVRAVQAGPAPTQPTGRQSPQRS